MPANVTRVDQWMQREWWGITRQKYFLVFLGIWALFPLFFMSRAIVTANSNTINGSVADTLGNGGMGLLFLTLLITPLNTITRQRWFIPLRRWYGIMFGLTIITDGISASITTAFLGGPGGRVAGHVFLLIGFTMVLLVIPLVLTANNRALRWLGRYWKPIQRTVTYVIWGLLGLHLALLEGLGHQVGANGSGDAGDGDPVFHQRLYQYLACSLFLLVLRLPPVTRWIAEKQKAGENWKVYAAVLPLFLLFVLSYTFIVNEEIFKGIDSFTLHPSDE